MKHINFWKQRLPRRAVQMIGSRFYINPDFDLHRSVLVAGTARSGTTWLGEIIASQIPCRILFEPFNPDLVSQYGDFHYFQYMQPGTENHEFYSFAKKVFTGDIRNRWIDHKNERIVSEYRLVKAIRANLSLKWLHDHFPEVPIVLIIRHPCSVVLSRMELGWATDNDIVPFLSQPDLVTDYLGKYLDLIYKVATAEEKHAIIWSVSNLIPLKQFSPGEIKIVYYENLCIQPEIELPAIFRSIGQNYKGMTSHTINRPSQTSRERSAILTSKDKITRWKKLNPSQIDNILQIVDQFGLSHLYGDSILPLENGKA